MFEFNLNEVGEISELAKCGFEDDVELIDSERDDGEDGRQIMY